MPDATNMHRAKELLSVMLAFLAKSGSFWYTINGDPSYEFSLCRRLGFASSLHYYAFLVTAGLAGYEEDAHGVRQLKVSGSRWKEYLKDDTHMLTREMAEADSTIFDMNGLLAGRNQKKDERKKYHVIRIGD